MSQIKLTQELKQTQRLSPLQIQMIKLIELQNQELEQRVRKELEENPVLDEEPIADASAERDDEENAPRQLSLSEYKEDDYIPSYRLANRLQGSDPIAQYNTFCVKESFTGSLLDQLGFRNLDEHKMEVGRFIICSLDDDGYLRRDTESLVDDMAFRSGIETDSAEVLELLGVIQEFEPAGVGARDLRECLMLQMPPASAPDPDGSIANARRILKDCFQDFTAKHFDKIMQRLGTDQKGLKAAMAHILRLNPSPGGQVDDSYSDSAQQVVPDFILNIEDGNPRVSMPRFNIPELRVNKKYADILLEAAGSSDRSKQEAAQFVKQKLDSAKWFVEAIRQRHNTLMKTMQAIVDYQHDFFVEGDETLLRPMVLKDIAAITGFDISTVSRVVNSKYIETHFGIYKLKYFFSEGLENAEGETVSTREIKKVLSEVIEAENKTQPLTDDELAGILSDKGYKVARRTVAKYRDQLSIPTARLRKELI